MEKSVVTPDQYPLTLNALTNACNQKSARNPVMSLDQGVVERTARGLREKHLVRAEENFRRGVEKYLQRFCNTTFSDYQFDPAQFAIICLLLLRGPQTPGELRANSGRLHTFVDNAAVSETVASLIERDGGPLIAQLARTPGRKDAEYMHLFFGPIEVAAPGIVPRPVKSVETSKPDTASELEARVSKLESALAELKAKLNL
jgi:uncharacterized protein YceH (UPF0502 family)